MFFVYGGIAICVAVIGTFGLLELVTWWFRSDEARFRKRRLRRAARKAKRRP